MRRLYLPLQLEENLEKAKRKSKTAETANKVQLMRIKNKATGPKTVSVMDRVYFNIDHPKTMPSKTSPVFISKLWTVGKIFICFFYCSYYFTSIFFKYI